MRRSWTTTAVVVVWVAMGGLPMAAEACSVCFGQTDSPLGKGLHWGVFALLMCIMGTLVAFGTFAVYLVRRAAAVEAEMALESGAATGVQRRSGGESGVESRVESGDLS
ncbi:MAG: hypothetical protein KF833_11040 [Verrucomicrobiae bacterium]|nr:hypothetical protein [Verrucomicrobiae bacterium]